jgi:hypothetical protein
MQYYDTGYRRLAATILLTAVQDIQEDNQFALDAEEFLRGQEGREWLDLLDFCPEWIVSELDDLDNPSRPRASRRQVPASTESTHPVPRGRLWGQGRSLLPQLGWISGW